MDEKQYIIRSAIPTDRSRIASLIHFGSYIHQHLDWKSPLDLIGREPFLLIENDGGIAATLACPPDIPDISWIRLFAVSPTFHMDKAWWLLWTSALERFKSIGSFHISALSMQGWLDEILIKANFIPIDNVIVLMNISTTPKIDHNPESVSIRPMMPEDHPVISKIDNSAFNLEWRNSEEALEFAYQQSSYTTVAEVAGEIVGFQYSTSSGFGGHLARLAILEDFRGKGIGYYLVNDVLQYFRSKGVMQVTVNTQQSNTASLALYAKAGFQSTGESYRVYRYTIGK